MRSSSECIYGGVWRRCCRGGRAVSIASPSVEQQVRIGLPSEAGVYVCMAGVVVVTLPYLCWPGWHRRELYICQGGSWVRSLPQVLLTLIGASYWKAHIHTTPARPSCIPSTVFIGIDRRLQGEEQNRHDRWRGKTEGGREGGTWPPGNLLSSLLPTNCDVLSIIFTMGYTGFDRIRAGLVVSLRRAARSQIAASLLSLADLGL